MHDLQQGARQVRVPVWCSSGATACRLPRPPDTILLRSIHLFRPFDPKA